MSNHATQKSVKKALNILKSVQVQLSTKNKEADLNDVLNAIQKEETALEKKREKVLKRQDKVAYVIYTLNFNKTTKKTKKGEKLPDMYPVYRKFYDASNRPVVTICTVTKGNMVYEGWAICSDVENPRHKKGDNIALKRVAEVLVTKKNTLPIQREDAVDILDTLNLTPHAGYKSVCYNK